MRTVSFTRFEIVYGSDARINGNGIMNLSYDFFHGLIDHGTFVDRIFGHGGGVDTIHGVLKSTEGVSAERIFTAQQPASAVRRAIVPFRVTKSGAKKGSVPHIHGNQKTFSLLRGYGSFTQDPLLGVDIIVDRMETIDLRQTHALENDFFDNRPIQFRETPHEIHIMKIILHGISAQVSQFIGDFLLLFSTAGGIGHLLVIVRDAQAQIAAPSMNDQIQVLTIAVDFNKMVAAAERSQTFPRPTNVDLLDTA